MLDDPDHVFQNKTAYMEPSRFRLAVTDVFKPLEPLAAKLHRFIHIRGRYDIEKARLLYPFTPEQDFTEYLNCFEETIVEMESQQARREVVPQDDLRDNFDWSSRGMGGTTQKSTGEFGQTWKNAQV
jgi:hypothetical protein